MRSVESLTREEPMTMNGYSVAFGALVLTALSACAATPSGPRGYDLLIARDATGKPMQVMPSAGLLFREGSRQSEDIQVQLTSTGGDERMKVYSADGARLIADVSIHDVGVQHRSGRGAFADGDVVVPAQTEQIAAIVDGR